MTRKSAQPLRTGAWGCPKPIFASGGEAADRLIIRLNGVNVIDDDEVIGAGCAETQVWTPIGWGFAASSGSRWRHFSQYILF